MLTDEQRTRIESLFYDEIQGGSSDDMYAILDRHMEDDDELERLYRENELEVCAIFDNNWFTCETCGWTFPIAEMADNDNWECESCAE